MTDAFPSIRDPSFGLFDVFRKVAQDGQTRFHPVSYYADERHRVWVENRVFRLPSNQIVAVYDDVTQRISAEKELTLFANVFHNSGEAIVITDQKNLIVTVNRSFTRLTGYPLEEVKGRDPKLLSAGRTPRLIYQQMWTALNSEGFWQGELWDRTRDGQIYPKWAAISVVHSDQGEVVNHVGSFTDISERIAAERQIEHLAHHDSLTGLLNRFSLLERLEQSINTARRGGGLVALLYMDLDNFKNINDSLGHLIGDELLKLVATRLTSTIRRSDIASRIGGDEFVVILTQIDNEIDPIGVAEKIISQIRAPFPIDEHTLFTSTSIGISLYPIDGEESETLMRHADAAMYQAKRGGKGHWEFFSPDLDEAANRRLALENELRQALERDELILHYQPQYALPGQQLLGVEALIRWSHPERGMVYPGDFIPLAEECGLIDAIGDRVVVEACRQLAAWREQGIEGVQMAINVSSRQLHSDHLYELVVATLERFRLWPAWLEIEVTETAAMERPEEAIKLLSRFDELGVSISIDDFGTGYSSLAYLKMLPIHRLKLDRTFVRDITSDENDAAICSATIALAHSLGLQVVAEGVEEQEQEEFLARHECDFVQGYLYSRPVPAETIARLAKEQRTKGGTEEK